MASFLWQLHTIPCEEFALCGFESEHYSIKPGYLRHIGEKIEKECANILSFEEIARAKAELLSYAEFTSTQRCFVHYDLSGNTLVDMTSGRISGVIDFSDADIFDPAADFARLFELDESFAKTVLQAYPGADTDFQNRAWRYYQKHLLIHLPRISKKPEKLERAKRALGWLKK